MSFPVVNYMTFLMDTLFSSPIVTSHSLPHCPVIAFDWKEVGICFSFLKKDWTPKSHGRYTTRALGGSTVPCESADVGGGQWEWCISAGFALCAVHTPGRRLICEWPHQAHRSASACHSGKAHWPPSCPTCGNRMPQTCWCLWVLLIVQWNIGCGFLFRINLGLDETLWTHDDDGDNDNKKTRLYWVLNPWYTRNSSQQLRSMKHFYVFKSFNQ